MIKKMEYFVQEFWNGEHCPRSVSVFREKLSLKSAKTGTIPATGDVWSPYVYSGYRSGPGPRTSGSRVQIPKRTLYFYSYVFKRTFSGLLPDGNGG